MAKKVLIKRVIVITLIALMLLSIVLPAIAFAGDSIVDRDPDSVVNTGGSGSDSIWDDENLQAEDLYGNVEADNGMLTKLFIWLIQELMHGLNSIFGLHDPVTLFFNVSPEDIYSDYSDVAYSASYWSGRDVSKEEMVEKKKERLEKHLYVDPKEGFLFMFGENEKKIILGVMQTFEKFLQIPYAVAIAMVGFLIFMKGIGSDERSTGKVLLTGILLYPLLMRFFPYLFEPIFWLNDTIVRALGSVLMNPSFINPGKAVLTRPFVTILIDSGTGINSLSGILAALVLFIMTGIINFQYFVRRFMLALLIMMFPIVAFLQIFPGTRGTFRLWWSEFTANLFLQSAHAMVYVLFVGYVYNAKLPLIPVIAMLTTLSTMSTFVRSLMGCQPGSGVSGAIGGVMGISALMGAGKIAKDMVGGLGRKGRFATDAPSAGGGGRGLYAGDTGMGVSRGEMAADYVDTDMGDIVDEGIGVEDGVVETGTTEGLGMGGGSTATLESTGTVASEARERPEGLSQTGLAWGLKPRVERANWKASLGRTAATAGIGMGAYVGAIVGGAAMGPAGVGLGAYAASMGMRPVVAAGDRIVGVVSNYKSRQEIVEDIMVRRELPMDEAMAFAATGIEMTPEEVQYDKELYEQYMNFANISGFDAFHKPPKPRLPEEEVENIRVLAARERERFMEQNPGAGIVATNQHILDNVIRPSIETYFRENPPTPPESGTGGDQDGPGSTPTEPNIGHDRRTVDDIHNPSDVVGNII